MAAIVASVSAFAADLGPSAPAPAPVFTWTGFYLGVNGGYGWNGSSVGYSPNCPNAFYGTCSLLNEATCAPPASFNVGGGLASRPGSIQLSIEFELVGWRGGRLRLVRRSRNRKFELFPRQRGELDFRRQRIDRIVRHSQRAFGLHTHEPAADLRHGRIGLRHSQRTRQHGAVDARGTRRGRNSGGGFGYDCSYDTGVSCFAGSSSKTRVGWTLGAGGEYAITNNITFKAEYLYVNLGRATGMDCLRHRRRRSRAVLIYGELRRGELKRRSRRVELEVLGRQLANDAFSRPGSETAGV